MNRQITVSKDAGYEIREFDRRKGSVYVYVYMRRAWCEMDREQRKVSTYKVTHVENDIGRYW